jgi:hypothetical protein
MSDYSGESIALLTQHGKESVIAPVLEPALGCKVELVRGFDTDQLGTFTRDKPRPGSQLDAARRKARTGMELSGLKVGIASEGSFGPDPFTGLFDWNVELLILIDDRMGIEVVGSAQAAGKSSHLQTGDWGQAKAFAEREGFPAHQLVLRPQSQSDPRLQKGISDWGQLQTVFMSCKAQAANGQVFVETDLRAFANPTRMHVIGEAAKDLLMRLQSHCPTCAKPGYWVTERLPGLPCALCGLPTRIYQTEVWQCTACSHRDAKTRTDETRADPRHCSHCNP